MNKTAFLSSILAAAALSGCAMDTAETTSSTAGLSFEEFKAQAIRETGTNAFIVDGDIVLHSEDALYKYWEQSQQGALSIYTLGAGGADIKWDDTQKLNITYCIGASFGGNKQLIIDAMNGATVNGWEKVAGVKFVHLAAQDANCGPNNNNVVFDLNQVTGQPYLARAFFPNSPRAERNVLIDTTAFNPGGNLTLTGILIHELGHTLGFRHEHIRPEAGAPECGEGTEYRGVTAYDKQSTMHYPQCNGNPATTLALTTLDAQGAAAIYGPPGAGAGVAPMASISAPANGTTVLPDFLVDAAVLDADNDLAKVELFLDGTKIDEATAAPFQFQLTDVAIGAHELKIVATDTSGKTAQSISNITVANSGGDGGGSGGGTGGGTGEGDGDGTGDITGGCSTSGAGGGLGLALALGFVGMIRRRRRS